MMEIGAPACSISVRVLCRESCKVIRRSPALLSRRPNSSEYHSGWTGVPAWSVITYSPPRYQSSAASPHPYAAPAAALSSSWRPIVSALQLARPGPVTTALDSASVLTFHRDNRMYEWTATRLPIGQDDR